MGDGFLFKSHSDYQFVDLFILSPESTAPFFFFDSFLFLLSINLFSSLQVDFMVMWRWFELISSTDSQIKA